MYCRGLVAEKLNGEHEETMSDYAHPEMLASKQWATDHLNDPRVRFVEVGFGADAYHSGHIPETVYWAWNGNVLRAGRRAILGRADPENLLSYKHAAKINRSHQVRVQE